LAATGGGGGASRFFLGLSPLGVFSISGVLGEDLDGTGAFAFLAPEAVLEGGVGGVKDGGFSFQPDILPSEMSFFNMIKSSSPSLSGTRRSFSSSFTESIPDFLPGLGLFSVGTDVFSSPLTSIRCTKVFGESAAAPSGGIRSSRGDDFLPWSGGDFPPIAGGYFSPRVGGDFLFWDGDDLLFFLGGEEFISLVDRTLETLFSDLVSSDTEASTSLPGELRCLSLGGVLSSSVEVIFLLVLGKNSSLDLYSTSFSEGRFVVD